MGARFATYSVGTKHGDPVTPEWDDLQVARVAPLLCQLMTHSILTGFEISLK